MAYTESGAGDPIVFLHGNPTSSYLWREVIPEVAGLGRCLAPDLVGMGDSDKLPGSGPASYTFVEHRGYLEGWFDAVGVREHVTLVGHDWAAALAFDWARRHPDAVSAIAYMEAPSAPHGGPTCPRRIALAAAMPCAPLLILDLGRPLRFLHMLRIFKPRSPMSMGAWCLSAFSATASIAVAADLLERPKLARLAGAGTAALGTYLGSYTGMLLASTAVPVWGHSCACLPPIFVCTAAATGRAALAPTQNRLVHER